MQSSSRYFEEIEQGIKDTIEEYRGWSTLEWIKSAILAGFIAIGVYLLIINMYKIDESLKVCDVIESNGATYTRPYKEVITEYNEYIRQWNIEQQSGLGRYVKLNQFKYQKINCRYAI